MNEDQNEAENQSEKERERESFVDVVASAIRRFAVRRLTCGARRLGDVSFGRCFAFLGFGAIWLLCDRDSFETRDFLFIFL